MLSYIRSENLKVKNTAINKLALIAPLSLLILSWFVNADYFIVDNFNWWYMALLPIFLTLECSMLGQKDGKMKNKAVFALPVNLKKIWWSKIITCLEILAVSCSIILLGSFLELKINQVKELITFSTMVINVEDSGKGFSPEELKYATSQFYQGDKSRSSREHLGMGLYISDKFVKERSGQLILGYSEKLGGALVKIELPFHGNSI